MLGPPPWNAALAVNPATGDMVCVTARWHDDASVCKTLWFRTYTASTQTWSSEVQINVGTTSYPGSPWDAFYDTVNARWVFVVYSKGSEGDHSGFLVSNAAIPATGSGGAHYGDWQFLVDDPGNLSEPSLAVLSDGTYVIIDRGSGLWAQMTYGVPGASWTTISLDGTGGRAAIRSDVSPVRLFVSPAGYLYLLNNIGGETAGAPKRYGIQAWRSTTVPTGSGGANPVAEVQFTPAPFSPLVPQEGSSSQGVEYPAAYVLGSTLLVTYSLNRQFGLVYYDPLALVAENLPAAANVVSGIDRGDGAPGTYQTTAFTQLDDYDFAVSQLNSGSTQLALRAGNVNLATWENDRNTDPGQTNVATGSGTYKIANVTKTPSYPTTAEVQAADKGAIEATVLNAVGSDTTIALPHGVNATAHTALVFAAGASAQFSTDTDFLNTHENEITAAATAIPAQFPGVTGTATSGGGVIVLD